MAALLSVLFLCPVKFEFSAGQNYWQLMHFLFFLKGWSPQTVCQCCLSTITVCLKVTDYGESVGVTKKSKLLPAELKINIWLCCCQTIVDLSDCYHLFFFLIMAIGSEGRKANLKSKNRFLISTCSFGLCMFLSTLLKLRGVSSYWCLLFPVFSSPQL